MAVKNEFLELKKILKSVSKIQYSAFYFEKYKKAQIDLSRIKTIADFEKIPFLTRDEIVNTEPKERLYISDKDIVSFNLSSGTTSEGDPLLIQMGKTKDITLEELYKRLKNLSVRKVMLLASISYCAGRISDWMLDKNLSSLPLILGDINNLSISAWIAKKMQIDGLETSPSALFFFITYLKEVYPLEKIKYISMGGEYVTKQRLKFFKQHFKNAYFDFRFGGAENQVLKGWRCQYLSVLEPRFFHPTQEHYYFEVVDPETGLGLTEGEEGELVETSKEITAFPLIRYKSGDIVRMTTRKCGCGRSKILEVLGRARNDSLKLYGVTLHVEEIEKVLAQIKGLEENFQIHVYEQIQDNRLKPKLVLDLVMKKGERVNQLDLTKQIQDNFFVSPTLTLSDMVKKEIFLPLEINFKDEWTVKYKYLKIIPHFD